MEACIFDIDDTLLDSGGVDGELYVSAIERVLGPVTFRDSWHAYPHVTDQGILEAVLQDNGVKPLNGIVEDVQAMFFELLAGHISNHGPFPEVPGAKRFLGMLQRAGIAIAYATGGWHTSAKMKLESAGFSLLGVPLATSDDSNTRIEIMQLALRHLGREFEKVTYYGDGEWDRTASQQLGWHFEPVGKRLGGITEYTAELKGNYLEH